MADVDLTLLQAHVIAQGMLIRALVRAAPDDSRIRSLYADELRRGQAGLPPEMLAFVTLHAELMLRPGPAFAPEAHSGPVR
ncbi:MAG: hypothetical protein ABIX37_02675 [Gammaproteobacteria bacterium]